MNRKGYRLADDAKIETDQKTLVWALGLTISLTAAGVFAWANVKTTAESAQKTAAIVVAAQAIDHDELVRSQEKIISLVDKVNAINGKVDKLLERSIPMNAPTLVTRAKSGP